MRVAVINCNVDDAVKAQAKAVYSSWGIDLTTAINVFLRKSIDCQGFPFEVRRSKPSRETIAAMEEAERGKDLYGPFDSVSDLMEALNA